MKHGPVLFGVVYGIADDQRRNRIAKLLEDYADRVQASVFEMILDTAARHASLHARLENALDPTRIRSASIACEHWRGLGARTKTNPSP